MADMAWSVTPLMGLDVSQADYDNLALVVKRGRDAFNSFCTVASVSASSRRGSCVSRTSVAAVNTGEASEHAGAADEMEDTGMAKKQRLLWMADTMRPNIHIAVHFHDFAAEYGRLINCNTLSGEDRHRQVLLAHPFAVMIRTVF